MSDLDNSTNSHNSSSITENKPGNNIAMAQTNIDFINTATKLIPVFDDKAKNVQSFIDALQKLELITGELEQLAVSIIKSRLKTLIKAKNFNQG